VLCASLAVLLLALPRFSPFEYWICNPSQGGTECSSYLNPLYPIAFLSSVGGTIAMFYGLFGRAFVLKPVFIVGMVLLEWSVLGLSFGYLSREWCFSARLPSGCVSFVGVDYGLYLPGIAGAALILLQSAIQLRPPHPKKATRVDLLPYVIGIVAGILLVAWGIFPACINTRGCAGGESCAGCTPPSPLPLEIAGGVVLVFSLSVLALSFRKREANPLGQNY